MMNTTILRIALPTPLRRLFDYLPPQAVDLKSLIPGVRVLVPFQKRTLVGILIEVKNESAIPPDKLKRVLSLLDDESIFSDDIYKLCQWASEYYHHSLGEVLSHALPTLLRKGKPIEIKLPNATSVAQTSSLKPQLNYAQQQAVEAINASLDRFQPFLLDGVTGSGKTEVYLRVIENVLNAKQQVLVLVPEISLTPQTVERFRARFSLPIAALHSSLSEKERLHAFSLARSGEIKIVIGTRSAVFTPFSTLGLIIVDEEHDTSFKQQERFRYHGRDLAVLRANIKRIPIVLGSATPSLESVLNVKRQRYAYLSLPERAGSAQLPTYQMIDLRNTKLQEGLSPALLEMMKKELDEKNQVLLFLNRRGFAPILYCTECSWVFECNRCDARLVYHRSPPHLQCHLCESKINMPKTCIKCHAQSLIPLGMGTQRLHETLAAHFSDVPIIRIDRDSSRGKGVLEDLLLQINSENKAILLGTQLLAKGHHFPRVTLVGLLDADAGLFSADFRATEQMGQLFLQVSGRAGREDKLGTVAIQTRHPEHFLLQTLIQEGYQSFSQKLLLEREKAMLPPYAYLAILRAESHVEQRAHHFLKKVKELSETLSSPVKIFGPAPAMIAKRKGYHCQHLLVQAEKRGSLQQFLTIIVQEIEAISTKAHAVRWVIDVDPIEV